MAHEYSDCQQTDNIKFTLMNVGLPKPGFFFNSTAQASNTCTVSTLTCLQVNETLVQQLLGEWAIARYVQQVP